MAEKKIFTGRTVISTNAKSITRKNLLTVLTQAKMVHWKNKAEIEYLFNYYKGKQPILTRQKEVRPDICNTVVVNRANEIVAFKTGYLCGEPIQYINRNGEDSVTENINTLNEYMFSEDKASQDEEIVEWGNICGTAYRLVLQMIEEKQMKRRLKCIRWILDMRSLSTQTESERNLLWE